jgi:hypothetical protein
MHINERCLFYVGKKIYYVWDDNPEQTTLSFLEDYDINYYRDVLLLLIKSLQESTDNKSDSRLATLLKLNYHQSLEALFSLVGALIQAPYYPQGWLEKYKNESLLELMKAIKNGQDDLNNILGMEFVSVGSLVNYIYNPVEGAWGNDYISNVKTIFNNLLSKFININESNEYNRIKHGFRISQGGFSVAVSSERQYGVPDGSVPIIIGQSDFGCRYIILNQHKEAKNNLFLTKQSTNWSLEEVILDLDSICHFINNIISIMRRLNGVDVSQLPWTRPPKEQQMSMSVKSVGVTRFSISPRFEGIDFKLYSEKNLKDCHEQIRKKINTKEDKT